MNTDSDDTFTEPDNELFEVLQLIVFRKSQKVFLQDFSRYSMKVEIKDRYLIAVLQEVFEKHFGPIVHYCFEFSQMFQLEHLCDVFVI